MHAGNNKTRGGENERERARKKVRARERERERKRENRRERSKMSERVRARRTEKGEEVGKEGGIDRAPATEMDRERARAHVQARQRQRARSRERDQDGKRFNADFNGVCFVCVCVCRRVSSCVHVRACVYLSLENRVKMNVMMKGTLSYRVLSYITTMNRC